MARCPKHDDKHPSLAIHLDERGFGNHHCKACTYRGDAYQFAVDFEIDPVPYAKGNIKNGKQTVGLRKDKDIVYNLCNAAKEYSEMLGSEDSFLQYNLVGKDENGRLTFAYFDDEFNVNGIKHHKGMNGESPYWDKRGYGSKRWYNSWNLTAFPKDKPLIIAEGERDTNRLCCKGYNAICSSTGARSVPDPLPIMKEFPGIIVLQDNDDAGRNGSENVAEIIYQKLGTTCSIGQWRKGLPDKFDVCDDKEWVETTSAIKNAKEYKLELPKKIGAFTVLTGKRASATTPPPTEWLIKGVLPKRFNSVLAGTTGSKKSMYAMQLGMSLANREKEFCGNEIIPKQTNVLYVDTEIGESGVHRRYQNIKKNMNWAAGDEYFNMMTKGGSVMDVWDMVHDGYQYFRPELIIFDSLYNSTACDDFSRAAQVQKVTNALTEFKERHGVSTLAIHHFNKGGNEMGLDIDRMSGASQLKNWIEWCMLLIKTNVKDFNLWQVAKVRDFDHDESVIGLKWNNFWFKTKGFIDDYKPFLISEEKKNKWQSVLEDCPEQFDTQSWLNVFSSKYPTMTERTGKQWLKECSESPMANKLSHGVYEKNLRLIAESDIDEL